MEAQAAISGVTPPIAAQVQPVALSRLIEALLPRTDVRLTWQHGLSAPVVCITKGYKEEELFAHRDGLARVRVNGKPPTKLEERVRELAWSIQLTTLEPADLGPTTIEIKPACQGSVEDGCSFEAKAAFAGSSRLKAEQVCSNEMSGTERVYAYRLAAPGKSDYVKVLHSGGSRGANTWLEITQSEPSCDQ